MDDQQNRRAESGLHAGTEREAGCNREGGDVAGMQAGGEHAAWLSKGKRK